VSSIIKENTLIKQYNYTQLHHYSYTLDKFLIPQGFSTFNSHSKVNHGVMIYDAHTNLFTRGFAPTNLRACSPNLRTYPPIVQHMWSTSYVPPRTQHLSNVSMKHTDLPRSYPHMRVTRYEPTIYEPTRSWHSISWSTSASMRTNNTHKL